MGRRKYGARPRFPWGKAIRNAGVKGADAGAKAGIAASVTGEPTTILTIAGIAAGSAATGSFIGDIVNHFTDDPSPVFDTRTTILFDLVGMTVCFLLFVIPAMILDATVNPAGAALPGFYGILAFGFSAFLVSILRGLLINLGLVREEDEDEQRISERQ